MRCVSCGEVHWNLRLSWRSGAPLECRICGEDLRPDRRRHFERLRSERPDLVPADDDFVGIVGGPAPVGPRAGS